MNNNDFFVSIIIPVYNGDAYLSDAVESIRRQNYNPLEIIIIDDGSTDRTAEIAGDLRGDVCYIYQRNCGPSSARNRGIKMARGEVIGFLDVDDLWPKNKLHVQLACLTRRPDVEIVLGYIQRMRLIEDINNKPGWKQFSAPFPCFSFGAGLFRRNVFDKVGLLDEDLHAGEDLDWFYRAKECNVSMLTLEQVMLLYRRHGNNMTREQDFRERYFIAALKKALDRRRHQGNSQITHLPRPFDPSGQPLRTSDKEPEQNERNTSDF